MLFIYLSKLMLLCKKKRKKERGSEREKEIKTFLNFIRNMLFLSGKKKIAQEHRVVYIYI